MSHQHPHRRRDPLVWGLILVAIGVIFLLDNVMRIDVWDYAWKLWPLILVFWGAQKLVDGLRKPEKPADPTIPADKKD